MSESEGVGVRAGLRAIDDDYDATTAAHLAAAARPLSDGAREILAELEADARPVSFDDLIADRIEEIDAEAFEQWQQALDAMPEPPKLPEIDVHDPVDWTDVPW